MKNILPNLGNNKNKKKHVSYLRFIWVWFWKRDKNLEKISIFNPKYPDRERNKD